MRGIHGILQSAFVISLIEAAARSNIKCLCEKRGFGKLLEEGPRRVEHFFRISGLVKGEKGATLCLVADLIGDLAWASVFAGDAGIKILRKACQSHTEDGSGNTKSDKPITHFFPLSI